MTLVLLVIWCVRRWGGKENQNEGQQKNLLKTILAVFPWLPVKAPVITAEHT